MLELFSSGLLGAWLEMAGVEMTPDKTIAAVIGPGVPGVVLPSVPDPIANTAIEEYLERLRAKGLLLDVQGVWVQTRLHLLASNEGNTALPAASITKVATSLAALSEWERDRQFDTLVGATGNIANGVLDGNLNIQGGGDPLFVWEEAIALGNALNKLGIRRVTGNLAIAGNFWMNFKDNSQLSGELLKLALDSETWPPEAAAAHAKMPPGTPKPSVAIAGSVVLSALSAPNQKLLIRHRSLPLIELLKRMNIYSNNFMAETLADGLGGAKAVQRLAAKEAGVSPEEIQLVNGSGLSRQNRISARAACGMFIAIQRYLQFEVPPTERAYNIADLFPISGLDAGTLEERNVPKGATVKTGSLWDVSALAGFLPTRDRGLVCFAIINRGDYLEGFRAEQDKLLHQLVKEWGTAKETPLALTRNTLPNSGLNVLGAPGRNESSEF
ncbi:MAG: D-alanyl-D-alanine carboxypeptidase [Oscillatoria sp. SIO1A7]|nr:D-alanyl-D-alanine carboxypeptidase [Oscillatoria sp. SIO1A7]